MNVSDSPSTIYPHLILGVRLGADKNEATAAMALATRRLRRLTPPGLSMADLTSSLARLDGTASSDRSLFYQWPADPRTIPQKFSMNFRGRAHTSARSLIDAHEGDLSAPLTSQDGNSLGIAFLSEAFDAVNNWEWEKGISLAREANSHSSNERIQDEALNIIAAAHLMMGKKGLAIAALKKAVEGEWNVGLHQNLAVLTMTDDPRAAIENLSFIIATSRNADQRVSRPHGVVTGTPRVFGTGGQAHHGRCRWGHRCRRCRGFDRRRNGRTVHHGRSPDRLRRSRTPGQQRQQHHTRHRRYPAKRWTNPVSHANPSH